MAAYGEVRSTNEYNQENVACVQTLPTSKTTSTSTSTKTQTATTETATTEFPTTETANTTKLTKTTDAQDLLATHARLYRERIMSRLTNFENTLDLKMSKFNLLVSIYSSSLEIKSRIMFLFPDANSFEEYLSEKIKNKENRERLQKAKMLIKIVAALVMSISFLSVARTMKIMLKIRTKSYKLRKARKEKSKRRKEKEETSLECDN